jgi:hypothetical protein
MGSAILLTLLFGVLLGGVWGGLSALMRKNGFLAAQDPGTQLGRNALCGIAGYLVATMIVGPAPLNFLSVLIGIVVSIITENHILRR